MAEIQVQSRSRVEILDITDQVTQAVVESGVVRGLCHVFVPHTTAGITLNEVADPDVARDLAKAFASMVPAGGYQHREGNSDAHIKASLVGSSVWIPVEDGRPAMGSWQGVLFCEFDGPRVRRARITVWRLP
jgi:secondary thiamine-phosphate synthase enzyme